MSYTRLFSLIHVYSVLVAIGDDGYTNFRAEELYLGWVSLPMGVSKLFHITHNVV